MTCRQFIFHWTQSSRLELDKQHITPDGKVTAYFDSNTTPESAPLNQSIEQLLAETKSGP
jgi:hypothetical protein